MSIKPIIVGQVWRESPPVSHNGLMTRGAQNKRRRMLANPIDVRVEWCTKDSVTVRRISQPRERRAHCPWPKKYPTRWMPIAEFRRRFSLYYNDEGACLRCGHERHDNVVMCEVGTLNALPTERPCMCRGDEASPRRQESP